MKNFHASNDDPEADRIEVIISAKNKKRAFELCKEYHPEANPEFWFIQEFYLSTMVEELITLD
jgi:hypothetical protein